MKRALITGISGLALTEDERISSSAVMWCRTASVPMERTGEGGRHPAVALHRGDVEGSRLVV